MKKVLSITLAIIIISQAIIFTPTMQVYADETKVLTLGADLTEEQKQLVLNYLGVDTTQVVVVEVNNQDEHALLDNIATQQQIGTRTFSCSYIEPTSFGGIHIKTVNLNWVTSEMIRNALVTSGITNCNIICISPIEVSGTGALTGIFKAYDNISNVEVTAEAKELASEELITTCEIAEDIGQDEASSMMSTLKEQIITNEIVDSEQIQEYVEAYVLEHELQLNEEDIWKLVELLVKISKQDYNIDEIKQAYADIKQTAEEVQEATKKTLGFFERIALWFKNLWNWITGKAQQINEAKQAEAIRESMGILAETDDSLLGDNTIVTDTLGEEVLDEISTEESESESTDTGTENKENKKPWFQFAIDIFNTGNKDTDSTEETETTEVTTETEDSTTEETHITFDDFSNIDENSGNEINSLQDNEDSKSGLLQYIQSDFENIDDNNAEQNNTTGTSVKSFNELTQ